MKKTSFEKRLKRRITGREHSFFAACAPGFKNLCRQEMLDIGCSNDQPAQTEGGVEFTARPDRAMAANLCLRIPLRILMRIIRFKATSFDQLEKKASKIDWEVYLPADCNLDIKVTTRKSRLYHSDAVALRVQKIIREHLAFRRGDAMDSASAQTLFIRADDDEFTFSIDTTGEPLFKRGIKQSITRAPLRENIAAAMLLWAKLSQNDVLIDPMCGSGTFSLEAAMIITGTPPGLYRSFAFEHLPGFSQKTFEHLKKEAAMQIKFKADPQVFAFDADEKAIEATRQNILSQDFAGMINVQKQDFFSLDPNRICPGKKGVLVLNPPYGKRLEQDRLEKTFFHEIKKKITADFKGWRLAIIHPSKNEVSQLGPNLVLRTVFHGGMDAIVGIGIV